MSWPGERQRHAMSARGVTSSTYQYNAHGKRVLKIGLPSYTKEEVKHLSEIAQGKEWIAELSMLNGHIIIDDVQISDKLDYSELRWNIGDDVRDVGYIHYHPPGIIPEFSSEDFVLAFQIHKLRKNCKDYPYTIMGLVYPSKTGFKMRLYGVKPSDSRMKQLEGVHSVESSFNNVLEDMIHNGELIKMKEVSI